MSAQDMSHQPRAPLACTACRKGKRKCDKTLPKCGLCSRTGRRCDYDVDAQPSPPSASDFAALVARLSELEDRLSRTVTCGNTTADSVPTGSISGSRNHDTASSSSIASPSAPAAPSAPTDANSTEPANGFPSALFLDIDLFKNAGMRLPAPLIQIPLYPVLTRHQDVLGILTQENNVVEIASMYFKTVHAWMPIVSKKRIELGIPLRNSGPDLAMLFLAMRLVTSPPGDCPSAMPLYSLSQKFLALFESSGGVSIFCLQAMILVALYEYSQAIYPAAWMTVGACARYADLLGITSDREDWDLMDKCTTWTEAEERRRVWWGIYTLDRVIALGSRGRFSAPEPVETASLPVDDTAWVNIENLDEGDPLRAISRPLTTPLAVPQPQFARVCQSAVLISRCLTISRQNAAPTQASTMAHVYALADELCGFITTLEAELPMAEVTASNLHHLAPRCLAWSALFILIDPYCCPQKIRQGPGYTPSAEAKTTDELGFQIRAVNIVKIVNDRVHSVAMKVMDIISELRRGSVEELGTLSPFSLDILYCVMVTFHWICREGGDNLVRARLADMERCLNWIGERWKLSREYLSLEEYHNTTSLLASGMGM
ncbi:hypothetical protein MRS44_017295 [Fusarium solani]|uniref:uncharacterized protein n=1 Tax=Fusarium solani TaxID=169388 RepID=UPI0032C47019|nr:hypothetical protein MRS44_017295 [Fusarium solani]